MKSIWKFPLSPITEVQIPAGAEVLTVKTQHGRPMLWMLVDPEREKEPRRFACIGTGDGIEHPLVEHLRYIDTFMVENDALVFHVFEVRTPATLEAVPQEQGQNPSTN